MRRFPRRRVASEVCSTHLTEGGRAIGRFHIRDAHKRRGGLLPARLRFSAHRGVTLVELLVALLILFFVCASWPTIFQVLSTNRESYRREAVERLAGMMDVISQEGLKSRGYQRNTYWHFGSDGRPIPATSPLQVFGIAESSFNQSESPLGYRLRIKQLKDVKYGWIGSESRETVSDDTEQGCLRDSAPVLIGELFEQHGTLATEEYDDNEEMNSRLIGKRIWRATVVLRKTN